MKRFLMMALVVLTGCSLAWGIPAKPGKVKITQPDGTQLTIELHGDEYRHFTTTGDGYTVVKANDGFYYYAVKNGTELLPSQYVARDASQRTVAENIYLSGTQKRIMADMTPEQVEFQQRARSLWGSPMMKAPGSNVPNKARYDYSKFKGLIVLIEWSDRSFTRENTKELFEQMVNQKNYTGYQDDHLNQYVECTGSVTDYFFDNSNGIFQPQFDIAGPVKVGYSCTSTNGGNNLYAVINSALQQINPDINFADYDENNDGRVDMVYFVFAGYASSTQGNDSRYVWPHASTLAYYTQLRFDNKRFGRYACSTEFDGLESYNMEDLCGIGTICHEFSHVLGLMDHYDTDYEENGQSYDPGSWDIMAGGNNNNNSRTPAGYNAFEKYTLGFMPTPEVLDMEDQNYSLEALNVGNKAYRINTSDSREYFLVENRQNTRWDSALPGHGMLVWRADSTNAEVWPANQVNIIPEHNYFELVRATPTGGDTSGDPFPGKGLVEDLTNDSEPANLLSWAGKRSGITLTKIKENDGIITFRTAGPDEDAELETFESIAMGTADGEGIQGQFCNWDFDKVEIAATQDDFGEDAQMLAMKRSGIITSSELDKPVRYVTFKVWNSSNSQVQIQFSVKEPGSTKWTNVKEATNTGTSVKLKKKETATLRYVLDAKVGTSFRIQHLTTSNTVVSYVDNIKLMLEDPNSIATGIQDVNIAEQDNAPCYNLAGQRVSADTKGIIVRNGKKYINK